MLFRPVYGPELNAIWSYIAQAAPVKRAQIYNTFLPTRSDQKTPSKQNIDDALTFLQAAGLVHQDNSHFLASPRESEAPFRLLALARLQALAREERVPSHDTDVLYLQILDQLFIKPDRMYVANVHAEANSLRSITELGGLSQEKIRSWQRVMAFLGIGYRLSKGFQCVIRAELLLAVLRNWTQEAGFIQDFLEKHLVHYLPFQTETGDLASSLAQPLLELSSQGEVRLSARQDAPTKPYFGDRRLRYLERVNRNAK